jgi:hypothetical protein
MHPHPKQDFAILNGWSHPVLNFLLRWWRDQNDDMWVVVMLVWQTLPAAIVVLAVCLEAFRSSRS